MSHRNNINLPRSILSVKTDSSFILLLECTIQKRREFILSSFIVKVEGTGAQNRRYVREDHKICIF